MSILLLGASRNIGHHVAHILLHDQQSPSAPELKLTLLLRNDLPSDDSLTPFIASGQVQIVKGDAMKREDIQRAWDVAGGADVRAVVYTVGTPAAERSIGLVRDFSPFSLSPAAELTSLYFVGGRAGEKDWEAVSPI